MGNNFQFVFLLHFVTEKPMGPVTLITMMRADIMDQLLRRYQRKKS